MKSSFLSRGLFIFALFTSVTTYSVNLYWIGGTGNWGDGSHWSTSSGGAQSGLVPTSADNVFFDANSFTGAGQTVTVNVPGNCLDMNWTGATNTPQLYDANQGIFIYGSLTLISNMTVNIGGLRFQATNTGKTITTAGVNIQTLGSIYFDGVGGSWTLLDSYSTNGDIYLLNGTLNTNSMALTCKGFYSNSSNTNRGLTLGSSVLTTNATGIGGGFSAIGSNLLITAGTSTVVMAGTSADLNCEGHALYDVVFVNSGNPINLYGTTFHNVICNRITNLYPSAGQYFSSIEFQQDATTQNAVGTPSFGKAKFMGNWYTNHSGIFDTLILSAGKTYTLWQTKTQTVNNSLQVNGTCSLPIILKSASAGSTTNLSAPSGTVTVNFAQLQDISAIGGATFQALNSVDAGNNSGWNFITPTAQNFYWIGGTGNWNDPNHWSTTSGGAAGACLPTRYDNVYFDANSFTAGSKIVTINAAAECRSIDWTGSANTPVLNGTNDLSIYGSLTLVSAMTNSFAGKLYFRSTGTGNTITSAGKSFSNEVHFDGLNGDWTLNDAFSITGATGDLILDKGFLITNDKAVTCHFFNTTGSASRGLYLNNSIITISGVNASNYAWNVAGTNCSIDGGTSTINIGAAGNTIFEDAITGNTYYNLVFQDPGTFLGRINGSPMVNSVQFNANGYISTSGNGNFGAVNCVKDLTLAGNNNYFGKLTIGGDGIFTDNGMYDTLQVTAGGVYTLTASKTHSIGKIIANGTCSSMITLSSSTSGSQATISATAGNQTVNFLQIQDIVVTGATFIANSSSNMGNNSGWTINAPASQNLYWVGGSGNWNDAAHWSLTQGGAGGACVPTQADNVFFTTGSFTAGSKVVTINVAAFCKNMNWTGAGFTPVLNGTSDLNIYGSLTLISAMNIAGFSGKTYFKGTSTGNAVTSAGKTFNNQVYFDGAGGSWVLQDALNAGANSIFLVSGGLNTNGKTVICYDFIANYTFPIQLTLGSSSINLSGTQWITTAPAYSLNAGTSSINFSGLGNFNGGVNKTYYNIAFQSTTQNGTLSNIGNYHNVTFSAYGFVYGGTFNKLDFKQNSNFSGTNTTDSLLLAAGKTNYFAQNSITTINKYFMGDGTAGNLTILTPASLPTYSLVMTACTVCCNYLDITGCVATGGANFYAANSTNNANNTGWTFASCPSTTLSVGPISGVTNTCANTTGYTYSIPAIAGATYTWTATGGNTITSGQGTTSIQVSAIGTAGTISVTASACGTSSSATKTITVNPVPVISSVNVTPPTTCTDPDGSATATITSGSSPFTYQWSSGDTLATADSLFSGQYQLTVSDLYGCITSTVVTINSLNSPVVTPGSSANVTCAGGNNGSLTANVTGGITPYSYAWTNGATSATANNLTAGVHVLTVTDSAGCQTVASYTVTQPAPVNLVINTTPSPCSGTSGSATVNASGGTPGYTYLWSSNAASQTTATASNLAAGLYSVTVTDNAGCQSSGSAIVSTNTSGASVSLDNITAGTCGSNGPGSIDITTSGGAMPYTYNWSNGATTEDITGVSPGTYSLGVIDANGCMTFTTYVVANANPNYQPEICLVTFDTTSGSNLVAWEKAGATGIQAYNIYCEIGSFNNYQLVGTVSADSLSEYIHVGANPDVKSWKYKISAVDSCGNESPLSGYHKTIHLQISQGNGGINNLSWDNYFGFNYGSFEVWRHTPTTNWVQLSSIAFCGFTICQNSYTDFAPVPGDTNRYAILITAPQPCITTARLANGSELAGAIVKTRSNVKNNRTTGIGIAETEMKANFIIYPNPSSKEITVQLGKSCGSCALEITNALGQMLRQETLLLSDNRINVADFSNGVYYLKVKSNGTQAVQKLIIQH
jgi:hypothetical protein